MNKQLKRVIMTLTIAISGAVLLFLKSYFFNNASTKTALICSVVFFVIVAIVAPLGFYFTDKIMKKDIDNKKQKEK